MPLYIPKGVSEEEHRFLYETFLGKEAPKNKFVRGVKELFSFHWEGRTSRIRRLIAEGAENRQTVMDCFIANPRWIRKDLSLGMKVLKSIKDAPEDDVGATSLRALIRTAYKIDQVLEWDSAPRHKKTVRSFLEGKDVDEMGRRFYEYAEKEDIERRNLLLPLIKNVQMGVLPDGSSVISYAFRKQDDDLIEMLINDETVDFSIADDKGVGGFTWLVRDANRREDLSRIKRCVEKRKTQFLLKNKSGIKSKVEKRPIPKRDLGIFFALSAKFNDLEFFNELIESKDISFNYSFDRDRQALSVLHWAAFNGSSEMIDALLELPEIDVDLIVSTVRADDLALIQGHFEIAERLRKRSSLTAGEFLLNAEDDFIKRETSH